MPIKLKGADACMDAIGILVDESVEFTITPLPCDFWQISAKDGDTILKRLLKSASTESILDGFSDEYGWSLPTERMLLIRFIDSIKAGEEFLNFLEKVAADEDQDDEDGE